MNRSQITKILTEAAIDWGCKYKQGVFVEFGLNKRGQHRIDLFMISYSGIFTGIEVKSCWADFYSDNKWTEYLEYFDKFYFCVPLELYQNERFQKLTKKHKVGIIVLDSKSGYAFVQQKAGKLEGPDTDYRLKIMAKMSWVGAMFNRNNRPKRTRRYLLDLPNTTETLNIMEIEHDQKQTKRKYKRRSKYSTNSSKTRNKKTSKERLKLSKKFGKRSKKTQKEIQEAKAEAKGL